LLKQDIHLLFMSLLVVMFALLSLKHIKIFHNNQDT